MSLALYSNRNRPRRRHASHRTNDPRRGSTLMIVMVLMGMLSLLGVIFYTFAAQERSNAEYYASAAKEVGDPSLDADTLFDWALEQIIVGTDVRLKNSMLWGSRHSLLSNSLGFGPHRPGDLTPFNGEGVNVIFDSNSGTLGVDQNRDGNIEAGNAYLLNYVDSPAAQNLNERQLFGGTTYFPQSDVGYTYPDINNVFLCYVGKVRDQNGNIHRVVKPSYLVPGILRNPGTNAPNPTWYNDSATVARSMRAHPNHLYVPPTTSPAAPARRYVAAADLPMTGITYPFPFAPMSPTYRTAPATSPTGTAYTSGRMGAYSVVDPAGNLANEPVEFDYDNDGDGIRESILIDLDFPPQQDSSGKMFVPLFLVTIHDLDALMNLNAHGNLAKILYGPDDVANGMATTPVSNGGGAFGTDTLTGFSFISQSNLGLGPSEVNPLWSLNARYGVDNSSGTVFAQHQRFFGNNPSLLGGTNPPWGETANMEFLWSKIGRPQYSGATVQDLYPGVYGELGILYQSLSNGTVSTPGGMMFSGATAIPTLPRPGTSMQDDNGDLTEGQGIAPFFQHPLDYTGQGTFLATPKTINWTISGTDRRITYSKYGNSGVTPATSSIKWGQVANLMNNSLTQGLGDDPNEVALYATDRRDVDSPLSSEEMLYLQLNNTEIARLNVTSRLANLLPFNFAKNNADNARGESIRRKFTTESNDRKSFGLPFSVRALGSAGTGQEYSMDPTTGTYKFPPQFGVPRYQTTSLAEDPLRMAVRFLLEIEINGTQPISRYQRKLSINSLLTGNTTSDMAFRSLMPHPDDPGTTPISTTYPPPVQAPFPPTDPASQEWWARHDRQQMARDIYVLLYLLGHGDDTVNTATTSNATGTVYSTTQLREMAQFAVNMVDALDRDSVMTRFEYDKDLSDGWNLDDDPYSSPESAPDGSGGVYFPKDSATRGEVYGIERLELSISEGLAFQTKSISTGTPTNHPATSYDDTTPHYFGFGELYNQSPFDVTFDDTEAWQVVITDQNRTWERALSLRSGAGVLSPGQRFTIASVDTDLGWTTTPGKSTFRVDPNWMMGQTPMFADPTMGPPFRMVPYQQDISNATANKGLDLRDATPPTNYFRIEDEAGADRTPGFWLDAFSGGARDGDTLHLVLRRRVHPTRSYMPYTNRNDNPFVEVDVMTLDTMANNSFTLGSAMDTSAMIQTQLKRLKSSERPQPLTRDLEGKHPATTVQANSLTAANSNAAGVSTVWQPQFDRDFASVMDLLYLPIFGPNLLTKYARGAQLETPDGQLSGSVSGFPAAKSAAARFLCPEDPANSAPMTPDRSLDNRWHRILELLEVPTRTNRNLGIGTDLSIPRIPGKINLNTLRHPENLAAMIDDPRLVGLDLSPVTVPPDPEVGLLPDQQGDGSRDWWQQFVLSRDAIDPYWASSPPPPLRVVVPLPGIPGSRPFRSLADVSYTGTGGTKHASLEDTILRSLPIDGGAEHARRRLLEIGNNGDHTNGGGMNVDPLIRNRLLSKIAGNATTRSNCFAIFISVKYFQAVADPAANGAIRIGGPLNGTPAPEHRGFFVVDRSKLEEGKNSSPAGYDFRAFVNYRKTLQ